MVGPLLESKYHVPGRRPGMVARPRLSDRLDAVSRSALTLVSAPAGFGKTTLLTQWLARAAASGVSVAWLSLDVQDDDPTLYWTYVVAALQTAVAGVGAGALALLQSPEHPTRAALASLLNDLRTVPQEIVLVLDDYHLIESGGVGDDMAFLLEHLPANLHLVVATRADPGLALARLRGRGELLEVRAADLRFTAEESGAYLGGAMGLLLTDSDVAALHGRTEGWVAALQMAGLSMQGRDDVSAFIAGFAGDDRFIVDYLAEEVLQRQPPDVRDFLLRTSLLSRLSGPLCDAVTGRSGGRTLLAALDKGNLFLVPLDDRRQWYRYHQLFADVLRAHLVEQYGEDVPDLHRRASAWLERNGEPAEAIRHALAAGDTARAADLVELAIPGLQRRRQEATIRGWIAAIPDEVVAVRPMLAIGFVGALMSVGDSEGVERLLEVIEGSLASADATTPLVVVDSTELARLPGAIELYRAGLALLRGDVAGTLRHAQRVLDQALPQDHVVRAGASGLSGLALWGGGDLAGAHRAYSRCVEGLRRAGHVSDVLGCCVALADIRTTQGRLGDAERTYEQALRLAAQPFGAVLRGTADMYVGLSQVAFERDDLPAAAAHLLRARELGEHMGLPQNPYRRRVAAARVLLADGDPAGAVDLLAEAERVYAGDFFPNVRPVPAVRARALLTQGRVDEALAWADERRLTARDEPTYLREYEHVTLARVLLAPGPHRSPAAVADADALLHRLLLAAEAGERTGSVIEILVLQALVHQARGAAGPDVPTASLQRALTLAEPEGYVRVFVDEGPPMAALLRPVVALRPDWGYPRRLLAACARAGAAAPVDPGYPVGPELTAPAGGRAGAGERLVEPLTGRELQVLRLLGSDLAGPDMARELSVSLNTLRTHTKNIYAKLGVTSRREAMHRASELGLLSRARDR